jgi:DNA polymerase III delta subunit
MVAQQANLYLFTGQDCPAKDAALAKIKADLLPERSSSFNLDTLYAKETDVNELQERLLCLPVKSTRRLVVLKGLSQAKKELKDFLLRYVQKPLEHLVLVMDAGEAADKDDFVGTLSRFCSVQRFGQAVRKNVFDLGRSIEAGRTADSLRILNQLLKSGEKPEMILGGLRHALLRSSAAVRHKKISLLLLESDLSIKTGGLKPTFSLEKLVVRLCAFK